MSEKASTPPHDVLMQAYDSLQEGRPLLGQDCQSLEHPGFRAHQMATLAVGLLGRESTEDERHLLQWILDTHPRFREYAAALVPHESLVQVKGVSDATRSLISDVDPDFIDLLRHTAQELPIGNASMTKVIQDFMKGQLDEAGMATWLAAVCRFGLLFEDTLALTEAMAASGTRYDYREHAALQGKRLIRRYPTGGLSEKTALILPSLIAAFANDYPVATPFLIARSLGFTGGTWDKLKSIPGFEPPHPGQEAIEALRESHCAMVVSKDDCNPADRLLYQLRSATGTVRSRPLAAASIASKQIVLPVHRLLLDVRYGPGAFFERDDAKGLGKDVKAIVERSRIDCDLVFTGMEQPNGMAIGNAVEVQEALAIMCNDPKGWDARALAEQKALVIAFCAKLMAAEFPEHTEDQWALMAEKKLDSGAVSQAFGKILLAHRVSSATVEELLQNPASLTRDATPARDVLAHVNSGILQKINQKKLGYLANFHLGAGGNQYCEKIDRSAGIVLEKRLGDHVTSVDLLCRIFPGNHPERMNEEFEEKLRSCFSIQPIEDM